MQSQLSTTLDAVVPDIVKQSIQWLKTGHYGLFVAHRRRYASLPKEVPVDSLTLEEALALLGDATGTSGRGSRRR